MPPFTPVSTARQRWHRFIRLGAVGPGKFKLTEQTNSVLSSKERDGRGTAWVMSEKEKRCISLPWAPVDYRLASTFRRKEQIRSQFYFEYWCAHWEWSNLHWCIRARSHTVLAYWLLWFWITFLVDLSGGPTAGKKIYTVLRLETAALHLCAGALYLREIGSSAWGIEVINIKSKVIIIIFIISILTEDSVCNFSESPNMR